MAKEILIFAILFFGFMTIYSLIISIRRKESFTPAIISFLMTSGVLLIFFGQTLYGSALFVIAMIVAIMYRGETLKIPDSDGFCGFQPLRPCALASLRSFDLMQRRRSGAHDYCNVGVGYCWADEKTFIQPVRLIPFLFLFVTPSAIDNG